MKIIKKFLTSKRVFLALLSIIIIGSFTLFFKWQKDRPLEPVQNLGDTITEETDDRSKFVGVVLRSADGLEMAPLKPIDQSQFVTVIESAWQEALNKAPQNISRFPNDTNLVAFQIQSSPNNETKSSVIYINKPIIIETKKVDQLPNNQIYLIDFDQENYQLLLRFSYTPQVSALDLPQLLTEAFNQILNHRRLPADQENNPYKILAFEALL